MGGVDGLRALTAPFPGIRFCPTGGITEDTLNQWLEVEAVAAVGGSWLTPYAEVSRKDWASITRRAERTSARLEALHHANR